MTYNEAFGAVLCGMIFLVLVVRYVRFCVLVMRDQVWKLSEIEAAIFLLVTVLAAWSGLAWILVKLKN